MIETYVYGRSKDLVTEKEEINCNNIIKRYKKMIKFNDVIKENIKEHNTNCLETPDYPYRLLIVGGSHSGKANSFFKLIIHQADIDKTYLCTQYQYEANISF